MAGHAVVSQLTLYPVKSAAGIALKQLQIGRRGPVLDRVWMAVDGKGGALTQRRHPRLALIRPALAARELHLSAPGAPPLSLPVLPAGGAPCEATVWGDRCRAVDAGAVAARWLSDFLGVSCRLVRMADDFARRMDPSFNMPKAGTAFADEYPVLLTAEASLRDLNGRLSSPAPMDRFRPNIVVRGLAPYDEDAWLRVAIGAVVFRAAHPCERCQVITVDQQTGELKPEPLQALAGYRKGDDGPLFGENLIPEGTGTVRLGDGVEVLDRRA